MKMSGFILKLAAVVLTLAAVTCCVLANLDRITDGFICLREKLAEKRYRFSSCGCGCDSDCDEALEEYEDWDD